MTNKLSLLDRETLAFRSLVATLIICSLSGLAIFILPKHMAGNQLNILAHVVVGLSFSVLVLAYSFVHFKRTLGIRKPLLILSGILAIATLAAYLYTGFYLAINGHRETSSHIGHWHMVGSLVIIALIALHLALHRVIKYRTRTEDNRAHTYSWHSLTYGLKWAAAYLFVIFIASAAYALFDKPLAVKSISDNYATPYGDHPFRPSQAETVSGGFIHEKQIAGAAQCASCHQDIARQWYSSVHRQAASDPVYARNVSLLAAERGIAATRYCEGCHTPVALLTGELTPGGKHGGVPGTSGHAEGVTCLSCHAMADTVHLDGVASYLYRPPHPYLFGNSDSAILRGISQYLIKISADQHKRDVAAPVLREARHCATCHTQFMDKDINNWGWVKMQDEYSAWLSSPFSRQHQQTFATDNMTRCQDCHMPLVKANDPSANAEGMIRSHRFLAANTMLPLISGDTEQLELTKKFLQSNKLRVTIEKPNRQKALQTEVSLDESLRKHQETPYYHYLGETVTLKVLVNNIGVGHEFPGGTIDLNQAWVELLVRDATGKAVYSSGTLSEDGYLDQDAHIYRSIPVDRHGKQVWTHELFNMVGETYKNVIAPGGSDIAEYQFEVPSWVKGPLVVDATVKYRKLNQRYAKWALQDKYQELPVVDMARDTLVLDILHEKEVTN
ncbi:multiheme c-type cytochrome [Microbulbifer rhizosphaerae]|uniref:Cytochrome c-552/4 domain-containing protein n=1 Tax=Microbulbifer rhizosphaerae TaxID=1562603 RepID=A0A7W4WFA9_9GAMM|nr:multiheme c-type cytochrome [Microbulbifer rhizosphaerae]MBB3063168.1 hypothetical protein [Microbulbifer rhizosphaerae]